VHVTAGSGCAWTAVSSAPWLTIAMGSGTGSGTADVSYTVAANPNSAPRTATVTIGGQVHTVTQDAAAPVCTYALSPAERQFTAAGGSGTVSVTTGATCAWTAVSDSSFVTVQTPSGTGSAVISYLVAPGAANVDRTATITVNGQVHTIRQRGTN
jgi:Viral BACON domain